jgi:hypothetical protein
VSSGPEHYQHAERLLAEAGEATDPDNDLSDEDAAGLAHLTIAAAQAHATLALAAATALFLPLDPANERRPADEDAWVAVAGTKLEAPVQP